MEYDVAVVGAGPAGLLAGEFAAKKGASVAVLDRKKEIGNPVRCAEGLGHPSFKLLGLNTRSDFVMNKVNRAVLISPAGKRLTIDVPYEEFSLYILDRAEFEKHLAYRFSKVNGKILLDTQVLGLTIKDKKITGLQTSKGDISAKVIVGADGVESKIGRWAGLTKRLKLNEIFTCAQHQVMDMEDADDHFEIHFGSRYSPSGYAWMFPKGKGQANLGLGVLASTKQRPLGLLNKFKKERAPRAHSSAMVFGCIPSTLPPRRTVKENVMLVGDAARQTNSVSGGGIANAIICGRIAGEVSGMYIKENKPISFLQTYERFWRERLERTLIKKRRQRQYLESDAKAEKMVRIMKIVARLKPIIPKSIIVGWLSPAF